MRTLAIASLILVAGPLATTARAQRTAHCRRVRAEAESQAFLLLSPSLSVQGVHVPNVGGLTGAGLVQGEPWQLRAGLSLSPTNMARGAMLLDAVDTECRRFEAQRELARTLAVGADYGRLEALRAQLAHLEGQMPRVRELVAEAERAREEQVITMRDLNAVRLRANALERQIARVRAEAERLAADEEEARPSRRPVRAQLEEYESYAIALENARSDIRRLSPWQVSVRAGIVPLEQVDWFGAVELSYNLGGIAQSFAEDAYVEARTEELRESEHEMRRRVERFERRMRQSTQALRDELALLDAQAALLDEQRDLLTRVAEETAAGRQSLRLVEMNRIDLEGQRIRQRTLLEAREAMTGGDLER